MVLILHFLKSLNLSCLLKLPLSCRQGIHSAVLQNRSISEGILDGPFCAFKDLIQALIFCKIPWRYGYFS
jgi:hypothetical protein